MIRLCSLGSGSSGNSVFVGNGRKALLLDAGFSAKQIKLRLEAAGLEASDISGIVLSHEHSDHTKGVGPIARALKVPVFANSATWDSIKYSAGKVDIKLFENGEEFDLDGISVSPFSVPHDGADTSAFIFRAGATKVVAATDIGTSTHLIEEKLKGSDYILIEANHDPEMLKAGPYPWVLKQRIASRTGHLSNEACAELLKSVLHSDLQGVTFAHLSETNNNADLVKQMARHTIDDETKFHVARQGVPGPVAYIE